MFLYIVIIIMIISTSKRLRTVTDEVERVLSEARESGDVGRWQIIDGVRIVGESEQLAAVDEPPDTDYDEVNTETFGEERLTNCLQTVVGGTVRDENGKVSHVRSVTGRRCKHLIHS